MSTVSHSARRVENRTSFDVILLDDALARSVDSYPMRQSMKLRHLRWYIAALLFTATVINYIDRQVIGVVKPRIMAELHLNQIQYGHVVQFFLVAYSVMYVVSGFLVDKWGTR